MQRSSRIRARRRGFSLVEVGVATFVIVVTALAGFAYYSSARVSEINEWHEQNALFLCEREIEAWHANGYTGLAGFNAGQVAPSFLPYGYRFGSPDGAWNQAAREKVVVLDGFTYTIKARNHHNANTGDDYYWAETWNSIDYFYRRVEVRVEWGNKDMSQETRMAR